jgi:hypothetical protein
MEMGKLQGDEKISVEQWDLESSYTSRFAALRKEMKQFHEELALLCYEKSGR